MMYDEVIKETEILESLKLNGEKAVISLIQHIFHNDEIVVFVYEVEVNS